MFFFQKNVSKKTSQKSGPAQVPKLLPLASPRDPEKANIKEQQCLSSFLVPIHSSVSPPIHCCYSLPTSPNISVLSQHLCCSSSWFYHFHICLACPLLPPTALVSLQLIFLVVPLLPQLSSTHISPTCMPSSPPLALCLPSVCVHQSPLVSLSHSASSLLDHASKSFAPLSSPIKGFFSQYQHGLVVYLIMGTSFILWASDDSVTS